MASSQTISTNSNTEEGQWEIFTVTTMSSKSQFKIFDLNDWLTIGIPFVNVWIKNTMVWYEQYSLFEVSKSPERITRCTHKNRHRTSPQKNQQSESGVSVDSKVLKRNIDGLNIYRMPAKIDGNVRTVHGTNTVRKYTFMCLQCANLNTFYLTAESAEVTIENVCKECLVRHRMVYYNRILKSASVILEPSSSANLSIRESIPSVSERNNDRQERIQDNKYIFKMPLLPEQLPVSKKSERLPMNPCATKQRERSKTRTPEIDSSDRSDTQNSQKSSNVADRSDTVRSGKHCSRHKSFLKHRQKMVGEDTKRQRLESLNDNVADVPPKVVLDKEHNKLSTHVQISNERRNRPSNVASRFEKQDFRRAFKNFLKQQQAIVEENTKKRRLQNSKDNIANVPPSVGVFEEERSTHVQISDEQRNEPSNVAGRSDKHCLLRERKNFSKHQQKIVGEETKRRMLENSNDSIADVPPIVVALEEERNELSTHVQISDEQRNEPSNVVGRCDAVQSEEYCLLRECKNFSKHQQKMIGEETKRQTVQNSNDNIADVPPIVVVNEPSTHVQISAEQRNEPSTHIEISDEQCDKSPEYIEISDKQCDEPPEYIEISDDSSTTIEFKPDIESLLLDTKDWQTDTIQDNQTATLQDIQLKNLQVVLSRISTPELKKVIGDDSEQVNLCNSEQLLDSLQDSEVIVEKKQRSARQLSSDSDSTTDIENTPPEVSAPKKVLRSRIIKLKRTSGSSNKRVIKLVRRRRRINPVAAEMYDEVDKHSVTQKQICVNRGAQTSPIKKRKLFTEKFDSDITMSMTDTEMTNPRPTENRIITTEPETYKCGTVELEIDEIITDFFNGTEKFDRWPKCSNSASSNMSDTISQERIPASDLQDINSTEQPKISSLPDSVISKLPDLDTTINSKKTSETKTNTSPNKNDQKENDHRIDLIPGVSNNHTNPTVDKIEENNVVAINCDRAAEPVADADKSYKDGPSDNSNKTRQNDVSISEDLLMRTTEQVENVVKLQPANIQGDGGRIFQEELSKTLNELLGCEFIPDSEVGCTLTFGQSGDDADVQIINLYSNNVQNITPADLKQIEEAIAKGDVIAHGPTSPDGVEQAIKQSDSLKTYKIHKRPVEDIAKSSNEIRTTLESVTHDHMYSNDPRSPEIIQTSPATYLLSWDQNDSEGNSCSSKIGDGKQSETTPSAVSKNVPHVLNHTLTNSFSNVSMQVSESITQYVSCDAPDSDVPNSNRAPNLICTGSTEIQTQLSDTIYTTPIHIPDSLLTQDVSGIGTKSPNYGPRRNDKSLKAVPDICGVPERLTGQELSDYLVQLDLSGRFSITGR